MRTSALGRILSVATALAVLTTALILIPSRADAAAPGDPLTVCGNTSGWAPITGGNADDLRDKLADTTAFGPGGTFSDSTFTVVGITTGAPTIAQLNSNNCDIWFSGFNSGTYPALTTFIANGGFVIGGCDSSSNDAPCESTGFPVTNYSNVPGELIYGSDFVNPITCGGENLTVTTAGGVSSYFTTGIPLAQYSDGSGNALVITDSISNPSVLLTGDIDMFSDANPNITSGPGIVTDQDQFVYNVFAYAAAAVTGQISESSPAGCPADVNLIVEKITSVPAGGGTSPIETFTFDVVCDDGWSETLSVTTDSNVTATSATGQTQSSHIFTDGVECTVTEQTPPTGWTLTSENNQAIILSVDNQTVTFTNDGEPPEVELIVRKLTNVTGTPHPIDPVDTFTIDITCDNGYSQVHSITTSTIVGTGGEGILTTPDLPTFPSGTECTVTETVVPAGWTLTSPENQTVTLNDAPVQVDVVNEHQLSTLTVTKSVEGGPAGVDFSSTVFTVDITCTGPYTPGGTLTITDQPVTENTDLVISGLSRLSTCTVVEDPDPAFTPSYNTSTDTKGGTITVDITNEVGELIIVKETIAPAPIDPVETFAFDIVCDNGYTDSVSITTATLNGTGASGFLRYDDLPLIAPGTNCTITEQTPPSGWLVGSNPVNVVVDADGETAQFTNTRETGDLTITTEILGTGDQTASFTIDISCTGDFDPDPFVLLNVPIDINTPVDLTGLPTGAECTVTQDPDMRFDTEVPLPETIDPGSNAVHYRNTGSTFSIEKTLIDDSPLTLADTDTFFFDVSCTNGYTGNHTITMSISDGTSSVMTPPSPTIPPGETCTITETPIPSNWAPVGPTIADVVIDADVTAVAEFSNRRRTTDLSIAKNVDGPPGVDLTDTLFEVEVTCTGFVEPDPFVTTGFFSQNTPLVLPGIPKGATCTFNETIEDWFEPFGHNPLTINSDAQNTSVNLQNRTGTFTLSKRVITPNGVVDGGTFDFDIVCDNGYSGTVSITADSTSTTTITYPDIPLFPISATCTITEQTPPTGWTLTSGNDIQVGMSNKAVENVTFTNTRNTANLTVNKALFGVPAGEDFDDRQFEITIDCTNPNDGSTFSVPGPIFVTVNTPHIQAGIPSGFECTVTEVPDPEFAISYSRPGGVVPITNENNVLGIVNSTGEVIVSKTSTVDATNGASPEGTFDFDITCDNGYSQVHQVTTANVDGVSAIGSISYDDIPLLPAGTTCTVTELPTAGWTVTTTNPVDVTINPDFPQTASFTNSRDLEEITITKTIAGLPDGTDFSGETFTLSVSCVGDFVTSPHVINGLSVSPGTPLVIGALPAGAVCTPTEDPDPRFTTTYDVPTATAGSDEPPLNITNTGATFDIVKSVTAPTNHPIDTSATFEFSIDCDNGTAVTVTVTAGNLAAGTVGYPDIPAVPPGTTCAVLEINIPDGFDTANPGPFNITATEDSGEIQFTNDRRSNRLTINKTVAVPNGINLDGELFDIEVSCTGDFTTSPYVISGHQVSVNASVTIPNLPVGSVCSVTETPDPRFAITYSSTEVTIGQTASTITITNSAGHVELTKSISAPDGVDDGDTFDFDYSCDNGAGGSFSIASSTAGPTTIGYPDLPLVPPGTQCTITELTPPAGWGILSTNPQVAIVGEDDPTPINFVNSRSTGGLTVNKFLAGADIPAAMADTLFTVDITCTGDFPGGTATFPGEQVSVNAPLVLADLPTGAVCTVVEEDRIDFAESYLPSDGTTTITDAGGTVTVQNTAGTFEITKTVTAPTGVEASGEFTFEVSCTSGFTDTFTITAGTGAPATIDTIPLIESGAQCTVTELAPPAGWTSTGTNPQIIVINPDASGAVDFTNDRDTSELTITKSFFGAGANDDLGNEPFTVDVTCTGDFPGNSVTFLDQPLSENTPLVITDLPTGAVCTVVEDPDPRFTPAYFPIAGSVTIDDDGESVDISNRSGTFSITKTLTAPAIVEASDTFTFDIVCTNGYTDTVNVNASTLADGIIGHPPLPLVAPGTSCTVTETNIPVGWTLTSENDIDFTVETDVTPNATFENVRDTTTLTVAKSLAGIPIGENFDAVDFTVTVTCAGDFPGGTYNVPGPLTISVNNPLIIPDLPTGATCTITETPDPRFATTYSNITGEIVLTLDDNNVTVINSTGELQIFKFTEVPDPTTQDPIETFEFRVECSNGYDQTHQVTANTLGGNGASGSIGYNTLPLFPAGTTCTITETNIPTGWAVDGDDNTTLTIETDGPNDATFTNTRTSADLVITKTLNGIPTGENLDNEIFLVDITCTGDFNPNPYQLTNQPLSVNTPLILPNLPSGSDCTITEQPDPRFTTTYTPSGGTITISQSEDFPNNVNITNTTGVIELTKTVVAPAGIDDGAVFTFDITCTNGYTDTVNINATTAAAGTLTYPDLPLIATGTTCTITEQTPPAGWNISSPNPIDVTIDPNNPTPATFTNTRVSSGLTITKTLTGVPAGDDLSNEPFTVDVTCTGDFPGGSANFPGLIVTPTTPVIIDDLPSGAICTATEAPDPRFTITYNPANATVTMDDDGETIAITNHTGTFSITKTLTAPAIVEASDTFTFDIVCTNGYTDTLNVNASTLADGIIGHPPIPLIAADTTCTITETNIPVGWTLLGEGFVDITIDNSGTIANATFENVRDTTTLTVAKSLAGIPIGENFDAVDFTVTVTCTGDFPGGTYNVPGPLTISVNNPLIIPDLPTGATCTITETPDPRFATTYSNITGEIVLTLDDNNVTVINSTGELQIFKFTEVPDPTTQDPIETFEFRVECSNGYDQTHQVTANTLGGNGASGSIGYNTLPLFPAGTTCTITETNIPTGWAVDGDDNTTLTIETDGPNDATFTNTRTSADLVITKTLNGIPTGENLDNEIFLVDITCTGDFNPNPYQLTNQPLSVNTPLILPNLPSGSDCTITEQPDPRFTTTYTPSGGTITISQSEDFPNNVNITNTTGVIELTKTVVAPAGIDDGAVFTFDITCTNGYTDTVNINATTAAAGTLTYPDLPLIATGTTCTITEQTPPAGWNISSPNPIDVTIDPNNPTPATFTNTRVSSGLTITKTLTGVPAGDDLSNEPFTVDVTCTGDFPGGSANFPGLIVTPTTPVIIDDLPSGAICTATEAPDPRFTITYNPANATVTMDDDGETIAITNHTGTFSITKTLTAPAIVEASDTFTFDIVCTNGYTDTLNVNASTLADGIIGHPPIPLIAADTTCTITETNIPVGWTLLGEGFVDITIDNSGTIANATFENVRDTTTLTVAKSLAGIPIGENFDAVDFTVTVTCTGDFPGGTYNVPGPLTISVNNPLIIPDLPTGATCTITETPDPRFATTYSNITGEIVLTLDDNNVTVINSTGELQIFKFTEVPDPTTQDPIETFEFRVECSNGYDQTHQVTANTLGGNGASGSIGYNTLPLFPAGTTCTITETNIPTGWAVDGDDNTTLTIETDGPNDATFTNTRTSADLVITKTLNGIPTGENLDNEIFLVDITCTGDFNPNPYQLTNQPLSVNTPLILPNLPSGSDCTITEQPDPRFTTTYTPSGGTITISDPKIAPSDVNITNTTGTLAITKTIDAPDGVNDGTTFTFDITCTNGYTDTISVFADTTTDGLITRPDLPLIAAGTTCTITEQTPPAGWSIDSPNPIDVTIDPDVPAVASFTNVRESGQLTITKSLIGVPAGLDLTNEPFTVDITCTGDFPGGIAVFAGEILTVNAPIVIPGLPTGATCTVVEVADTRFATTYAPTSGTVVIAAGANDVGITNATGAAVIRKFLQAPSTHTLAATETFSFSVNCTNGYSAVHNVTASLATPGETTYPDLPLLAAGESCTIDEVGIPAGWTLASASPVVVTIPDDGSPAIAEFTNTRDVGSINIGKSLVGVPGTIDLGNEQFAFDLSCVGDFSPSPYLISGIVVTANTPGTIDDLPTGSVCTLNEQPDIRFTPSYPDGPELVVGGGPNDIDVVNTTNAVSISKDAEVDPTHDISPFATFSFQVDCDNGHSAVHTLTTDQLLGGGGSTGDLDDDATLLFPTGTNCTFAEIPDPLWQIIGPQTIDVTIDGAIQLDFINRRRIADLVIAKSLVGMPAGVDLDAEPFPVTVTCVTGFIGSTYVVPGPLFISVDTPLVIENLPTGAACSVVEAPDPRFSISYEPTQSVGITNDGAGMTIVNRTGTYNITKLTQAPASDLPLVIDGTFTYDIECFAGGALVHSETVDLTTTSNSGTIAAPDTPLLAPGTQCQITEQDAYGWDLISADGGSLVGRTLSFAIPVGLRETEWLNERQLADFEVHKTIVGVPAGALYQGAPFADRVFTIDVTCEGDFSPSPYVFAAQSFSENAPYVIEGLPVGTTCATVEAPESEFTASYLPLTQPPVVEEFGGWTEVTNATGTFILLKNTTYNSAHPIDPTGVFSFHVICSDGYDAILDVPVNTITISGGTGAISYGDVPLFKPGTTCTVSEVAVPAGWQLISQNDLQVTITSDFQPTLRFVNERITGPLEIRKRIVGLPEELDLSDEQFEISVTCTGGYTVEPYEVPGPLSISENEGLLVPDLPILTECSVEETLDPRFGTSYAPSGTVTIQETDTEVTVINETSTFELTKIAQADTDLPVDLDEPWIFDITCISPRGEIIFSDAVRIATLGGTVTLGPPVSPLMPPGTDCTARERPNEEWLTEASLDGGGIDHEPAQFRTVSGSRDLEFRNTRALGEILVTKEILALEGYPADMEFELHVRCTGGLRTRAHVLDPAPVVRPGEPLVLDRLPEGSTCVITEPNPRWEDLAFFPAFLDTDDATDADPELAIIDGEVEVLAANPHTVAISNTFAIDLAYTGAGTAGPLTRLGLTLFGLGFLLLAITQPYRRRDARTHA